MKKVTLLVLTLAFGALLLVGCSDKGDKAGGAGGDTPAKVDKLVWSLERGSLASVRSLNAEKALPLINLNSPADMFKGGTPQISLHKSEVAQAPETGEMSISNPIISSTFYTRLDKKGISQLFPKESLKPIAVAPNGDLFLFDRRFGIFMTNLNEKNPLPRKIISTDEILSYIKSDGGKKIFKKYGTAEAAIIKNPDGNDYAMWVYLEHDRRLGQLLYKSSDGTITSQKLQMLMQTSDLRMLVEFSRPLTLIHDSAEENAYFLQYDSFKDEYIAKYVVKIDDDNVPVFNFYTEEFSLIKLNKEACAVDLFKMEALNKQVTVTFDDNDSALVNPAIEPSKLEKTNSFNLAGQVDCTKGVRLLMGYVTPSALWVYFDGPNRNSELVRMDTKDGVVKLFTLGNIIARTYTEAFGDLLLFRSDDNLSLYSSAKGKTVSLGKWNEKIASRCDIKEFVNDRARDICGFTSDGKFAFLYDKDLRLHRVDVEKTFESGKVVAEPVVDTSEIIISGLLWKDAEYWLGQKGGLYSVSNGKTTQIQKPDVSGTDVSEAFLMAVTVDDVEAKGTGLAISVPLTEEFACERGGFYCSDPDAECKDQKCELPTVDFKDENLKKRVIAAIKEQVYENGANAPTDKVLLKDCASEKFVSLPNSYPQYQAISDISGIEKCINLTFIDFDSGQNISDISALKDLKKLKYLNLRSNNISDISVLANLKELSTLVLDANNISNISALKGLIKLETILLSGNCIGSKAALSRCGGVDDENCSYGPIAPLFKGQLKVISISSNPDYCTPEASELEKAFCVQVQMIKLFAKNYDVQLLERRPIKDCQ